MKLREATLEDHSAIMAVHRRNGLVVMDHERWIRRWTENPFRAASPEIPMGWVLTVDDGTIVGTIGNVVVGYEWNGRRLAAAVVSAWAVDAPYRNSSLGLAATYFTQKGVDLLLNTTANQAAGAVFTAFRAERVPCPFYADRLLWITNYAGVAASTLRRRGVPGAGLLKYPGALALRWLDRLRGRNRIGRLAESVHPATSIDERFDAFWERLRRRPDTLMAVRNRVAARLVPGTRARPRTGHDPGPQRGPRLHRRLHRHGPSRSGGTRTATPGGRRSPGPRRGSWSDPGPRDRCSAPRSLPGDSHARAHGPGPLEEAGSHASRSLSGTDRFPLALVLQVHRSHYLCPSRLQRDLGPVAVRWRFPLGRAQ